MYKKKRINDYPGMISCHQKYVKISTKTIKVLVISLITLIVTVLVY